jgi:pSer/pThr/pTyr-binding forkhead associated (FHA) protein
MAPTIRAHIFDDEASAATVRTFTTFPIRVGREDDCELQMTHRRISRHHARIERVEAGLVLVDEGSLHGVWLNDVRLLPYQPVPLPREARVLVGPVTIMVHVVDSAGDALHDRAGAAPPTDATRTTDLSALPPDVAFRSVIGGPRTNGASDTLVPPTSRGAPRR